MCETAFDIRCSWESGSDQDLYSTKKELGKSTPLGTEHPDQASKQNTDPKPFLICSKLNAIYESVLLSKTLCQGPQL
jgi:hypothetical protein